MCVDSSMLAAMASSDSHIHRNLHHDGFRFWQASRRKEAGSEGEAEGKGAAQETENPVFATEGGKSK